MTNRVSSSSAEVSSKLVGSQPAADPVEQRPEHHLQRVDVHQHHEHQRQADEARSSRPRDRSGGSTRRVGRPERGDGAKLARNAGTSFSALASWSTLLGMPACEITSIVVAKANAASTKRLEPGHLETAQIGTRAAAAARPVAHRSSPSDIPPSTPTITDHTESVGYSTSAVSDIPSVLRALRVPRRDVIRCDATLTSRLESSTRAVATGRTSALPRTRRRVLTGGHKTGVEDVAYVTVLCQEQAVVLVGEPGDEGSRWSSESSRHAPSAGGTNAAASR